MDDKDIYVPAETPKPRWRDEWANSVDNLGGPFVAYPIVIILFGPAIYGIIVLLLLFLGR
jgi:hypothetical protein